MDSQIRTSLESSEISQEQIEGIFNKIASKIIFYGVEVPELRKNDIKKICQIHILKNKASLMDLLQKNEEAASFFVVFSDETILPDLGKHNKIFSYLIDEQQKGRHYQYESYIRNQNFKCVSSLNEAIDKILITIRCQRKSIPFLTRSQTKECNEYFFFLQKLLIKNDREASKRKLQNFIDQTKQRLYLKILLPNYDFQENIRDIMKYPIQYDSRNVNQIIPYINFINFILISLKQVEEVQQMSLLISDLFRSIRQITKIQKGKQKWILPSKRFFSFYYLEQEDIKKCFNSQNPYVCFQIFLEASKITEEQIEQKTKELGRNWNTLFEIQINKQIISLNQDYDFGYITSENSVWFNLRNIFEVKECNISEGIHYIKLKYGAISKLKSNYKDCTTAEKQLMKRISYEKGLTQKIKFQGDFDRLKRLWTSALNKYQSEKAIQKKKKNKRGQIQLLFKIAQIYEISNKFFFAHQTYYQIIQLCDIISPKMQSERQLYFYQVKAKAEFQKLRLKLYKKHEKNQELIFKKSLDYHKSKILENLENLSKINRRNTIVANSILIDIAKVESDIECLQSFYSMIRDPSYELDLYEQAEIVIQALFKCFPLICDKDKKQLTSILNKSSEIIRNTVGFVSKQYVKTACWKAYLIQNQQDRRQYFKRIKNVLEELGQKSSEKYRVVTKLLSDEQKPLLFKLIQEEEPQREEDTNEQLEETHRRLPTSYN